MSSSSCAGSLSAARADSVRRGRHPARSPLRAQSVGVTRPGHRAQQRRVSNRSRRVSDRPTQLPRADLSVSEGLRTVMVAFGALAFGFTWQSIRTAAVPASAPDRLIAELRLAQFAALILTLTAGAYIGFAVVH